MDNRMSLLTSPFVPEGMVDLMKKLSKGVIKERPSNIYEYAAAFFEKMLIERDGSLDKGYGKFRSYTEYCKFMDKMDQRRLNQTTKKGDDIADMRDTTNDLQEDVVQPTNIEVQGVAIQGVERKSKDNVKNVSINPKYKSQSEKNPKPVISNVKNVKTKPRKLSSKKPSENLIVIKEETSADVDDNGNGEFKLNKAAVAIQKAFRTYIFKKSSQGEHFSDTSANVSQLSEDAAAVIIQKAFKSLIQKLKPEAMNRDKVADESNNNVVITGAGQENAINVDKIMNNTDEHSEQILVDDDRTDARNDSELKESPQEIDDTTANPEIETTNLDAVTALDATETQRLEEMRIGSVGDEDRNQAATASENIGATSNNQDFASPQQNEISNPSDTSEETPDEKTEKNEMQEVTVRSGATSDNLPLKEDESVQDNPIEVESSEDEVGVSTSERLAFNETQVKSISEDPAETGATGNVTDAALENDDKEVGKIRSESPQGDVTTPLLNLSGANSTMDQIITVSNTETDIGELVKEEHVNQLKQTALDDMEQNTIVVEFSDNISNTHVTDEGLHNVHDDNNERDSSLTDNNFSEGKVVEPQVKDQLFVVENDGIYVNIDLLQEKFGTTTSDDPTVSDSEKTFKLNIEEREEILVNQENVQQIREEVHAISDDVVGKSSDITAGQSKMEIFDKEENNCDTKDEEGNEEYELAETVVLMDIPSKPYHLSEQLLPTPVPENVTVDRMKLNKLDDEIDKLESSALNERSLKDYSDSVKDDIIKDDVAETKPDEIRKNEAVVENLETTGNQMNEDDNSQSTLNLTEISIREHDIGEEKNRNPEIVKSEGDLAIGETNNENVESQLNNESQLTTDSVKVLEIEVVSEGDKTMENNFEIRANDLEVTDSEKLVNSEEVEDEELKNKNDEGHLNKSDLTSSHSEHLKAEGVIEDEETKDENIGNPFDKNDLREADCVTILKVDAVFEGKEVEAENAESQNKTQLTETDSEKNIKLEDEQIKPENTESQFNETVLTVNDDEKTVKVSAAFEDEKSDSETAKIELNKDESEPTIPNTENSPIKGNEIDGFNMKREHADDQPSESLQVEICNSGVNNELDVKSEKQLDGEDKECNVELELTEKDDEVVQENTQKEEENVDTPSTTEKIDSLKTKEIIVKRDIDAETTYQISENTENEDLVKAAIIIQKVFRGYIVRNSTTINAPDKKGQLELSAALIIQKYARGYLVRRNMQKIHKLTTEQVTPVEMKNEENDASGTDDNTNTEIVPQLPAYSNRFLIPKDSFLERESFADDEDYARTCKELAATSIQKTYRGYRVRRSLKTSIETDATTDDIHQAVENEIESFVGNDQVQSAVNEAERVISDVLNVAADVLPSETYDLDSFEDDVTDDKNVELESQDKLLVDHGSVLGQVVHDNIHVEGQMQQKYNQMKFQGSPINPIEETSDSSEHPETPREKPVRASTVKSKTLESDSLDSKDYDGSKSFSYEQLSSDLSDTEENKRESQKESEVDETSRDERDDLSEVENFDLSSCGEDSLEAMYYSLRKNEIMVDKMQKQVADQRIPKNNEDECVASENLKVEFPERVTENLDVVMQQVFKSMESSSDYDGGKKDEDDNSSALDLALDDSSSINDEKEIETSRQVKQSEEFNSADNEESESTIDTHAKDVDQSTECNIERRDVETNDIEQSEQLDSFINISRGVETSKVEQSPHSDSSVNSSTRFIMKSQSVNEDMMNPIMFAMKRKQALLDQLHVRPYPLQENLSEDHDAFPEHLLSDIDIGNIQRKIFASSVSETDSDYIEPNTTGRRLVRDDFNISTALDHLSTDSDSTIVSAATKIQAGARGFLTRRRLRRTSAGGTSISFEKRYSFGNAAIDKSLEDLIKMQEQINLDGAALKIQQQYRRYQARKNNLKKVSPIREQTTLELSGGSSIEGNEATDDNIGITEITLAQKKVDEHESNAKENVDHRISLDIDPVDTVKPVKRTPVNQRRLTLQRGDAVQRNSRPDSQESNIKGGNLTSPNNQSTEKFKDSETGEYTGTTDSKPLKKVTAYKNIQSLINRGIGPRQRSMPVQIDSELMRIIPKHLRKRVKSADIAKKKSG